MSKRWTEKEYGAACNALAKWMESQEIPPEESFPILARMVVVAYTSIIANNNFNAPPTDDDMAAMLHGLRYFADETLPRAFHEMVNGT